MNIGWYYSENLSPSDELVDQFADSKFGIDRWSSFAREIIQNSIDAQDDENKPVEVIFDLNKELKISDIPGGLETKDILGRCAELATNKQTKSSYKKGLEVLSKEYIHCLKISDRNTRGVKTGRDEAWGAFVFDEGKSIKQRPGSAGSHGVGKKVPFIISTCNTVFYATKNKYEINGIEKSDCLFQGKTTLISWVDSEGKRRNSKGWYGVINEDTTDTKNAIQPIDANNCSDINPYFLRKDEYGTDVIIVGTNTYDEEENIKKGIISAILENFFVAIIQKKLVIDVFGEKITSENFESSVNKYYQSQTDSKNSLVGCLRVFNGDPSCVKEITDSTGNSIGNVEIYFGLGNENNKKYYTVVRSHGMRITDYRVNKAAQPYTAVVLIEGKELNDLLSSLENAAHDSFVTKDENMDINQSAVYAIDKVKKIVADYIEEQTRIDSSIGQEIEGLSNIILIPGSVSSVNKKNGIPEVKRNYIPRSGKGSKSKDYEEGKTGTGEGDEKHKKKKGKNKPAKKGGEFDSILFENYVIEPVFMKKSAEYLLKLQVAEDANKADLVIYSINSEGKKDDSIADFIDYVIIDGTRKKCEAGKVRNVRFSKNKLYVVTVKMKRDIVYQLAAEIIVKENINEQIPVSSIS